MTLEERVVALEVSVKTLHEDLNRRGQSHEYIHDELHRSRAVTAGDLNRRLDAINHDVERVRADAVTYTWKTDARLRDLENKAANLDGKLWAFGAVVVVLVTLIAGAFRFVL